MDALSEMEKSVNSKIKSAVQSVKVWSPETIVSITWQHWHTQGKKTATPFSADRGQRHDLLNKMYWEIHFIVGFLGVFLWVFFVFFCFFGNNVWVHGDFERCYTKENKNLMAIGFFFGNFENLALMSVQILQQETNCGCCW